MRCNNLKLYPVVIYTVLNVYKSTINIKRSSVKHASKCYLNKPNLPAVLSITDN